MTPSPTVLKKPRIETIEEKALEEFKSVLNIGPKNSEERMQKTFYMYNKIYEVPLEPYKIEMWMNILESDQFIKLKIENILTFVKEHNIATVWVKIFEGLLVLRQSIDTFETLFDDIPKTMPRYEKMNGKPAISNHVTYFLQWIENLNKLIYWKRGEQK